MAEELPFPDSSVGVIHARQVMEHVEDLFGLMDKLYRVLHPSGKLIIDVPYWSSEGAFRDPTHVQFFSEKSFDYWDPDCECAYYAEVCPFKIESIQYNINKRLPAKIVKALLGMRGLKAFNNMIVSFNLS